MKTSQKCSNSREFGAGYRVRTDDIQLGKPDVNAAISEPCAPAPVDCGGRPFGHLCTLLGADRPHLRFRLAMLARLERAVWGGLELQYGAAVHAAARAWDLWARAFVVVVEHADAAPDVIRPFVRALNRAIVAIPTPRVRQDAHTAAGWLIAQLEETMGGV